MAKPITPKQRCFVSEYLIDKNATKAAIRAKYSKKTARSQGQRLLTNVAISRAIKRALAKQEERTEITADRILKELMRIGMVDIREAFKPDGTLKAIKDIPIEISRAISGIEVDEIWQGQGKLKAFVGVTKKIKFWEKTKALELLGKHLKLFIDRLDITGSMKLEDVIAKSHHVKP